VILVLSSLLFFLIATLGFLIGVRLWIHPKAAVDRVMGTSPQAVKSRQPFRLNLRRLIDSAGSRLGTREKDRERVIQELVGAGFRRSGAANLYYGSRVIASVLLGGAGAAEPLPQTIFSSLPPSPLKSMPSPHRSIASLAWTW